VSIVESHFLKAADSVARVELGRLFHQLGTVKVKVQKVILCCSLANHKLLEYTYV